MNVLNMLLSCFREKMPDLITNNRMFYFSGQYIQGGPSGQIAGLGRVDFGCSTLCLDLLGLMGSWESG